MPVIFLDHLTRDFIKEHPDAIFVFGDNAQRCGFGGQAREARGEPNSIGIATKRSPGMGARDFYEDDREDVRITIAADLRKVGRALDEGKTVYVPSAGIGTGLSQMPRRAPKTYKWLRGVFAAWAAKSDTECPWPPAAE
jgi:hypothetical protein